MSVTASAPIDLSSAVGSQEPLEVVLLITRTGAQLGAWTRNAVPVDVLSVMAATLVGSIETMMTALGASSPREVSLRAAMRQIVKSLPPFPSESDSMARGTRDRRRA